MDPLKPRLQHAAPAKSSKSQVVVERNIDSEHVYVQQGFIFQPHLMVPAGIFNWDG